jgi:hypothetical protein
MEPLNENELNQLLRKWEAPAAPPTLTSRVLGKPGQSASALARSLKERPWWRWLLTGTVRIPVPVAVAVAAVVVLWIYHSRPNPVPRVAQPATVSLADFKPVRQLQPVVVTGGQK